MRIAFETTRNISFDGETDDAEDSLTFSIDIIELINDFDFVYLDGSQMKRITFFYI